MKVKLKGADLVLFVAVLAYLFLVFGPYRPMVAMSPSMEPAIMKGSFMIGERLKGDEELQIGDICTYRPKDVSYTVTHRIVDIKGGDYVFKGDNNERADETPVKRDQILYRVIWKPAGH